MCRTLGPYIYRMVHIYGMKWESWMRWFFGKVFASPHSWCRHFLVQVFMAVIKDCSRVITEDSSISLTTKHVAWQQFPCWFHISSFHCFYNFSKTIPILFFLYRIKSLYVPELSSSSNRVIDLSGLIIRGWLFHYHYCISTLVWVWSIMGQIPVDFKKYDLWSLWLSMHLYWEKAMVKFQVQVYVHVLSGIWSELDFSGEQEEYGTLHFWHKTTRHVSFFEWQKCWKILK